MPNQNLMICLTDLAESQDYSKTQIVTYDDLYSDDAGGEVEFEMGGKYRVYVQRIYTEADFDDEDLDDVTLDDDEELANQVPGNT